MDHTTAKEATSLYEANANDIKMAQALLRNDWLRVGLSVSLEGEPKSGGNWRAEGSKLVSLNCGDVAHHAEAKAIAECAVQVYLAFYRKRIAERNRRLAQIGFKGDPTP